MKLWSKKEIEKEGVLFSLLYLLGFLMGVIFVNLMQRQTAYPSSILGIYFMNQTELSFTKSSYFGEILRKRGVWIVAYSITGITILGIPCVLGAALWWGILGGGLLTLFLIEYGIRGLLLGVFCFFPQCILYIPMALLLFTIVYQKSSQLWSQKRIDKDGYLRYLGKILEAVCLFVGGVFLESYVNPMVLNLVKHILK